MTTSDSNKILMAGIVGFLAGILYAPRKGSETQDKLKERWDDMKSDLYSKADKAKGKLQDLKSDGRGIIEKVDDKVSEAADKIAP